MGEISLEAEIREGFLIKSMMKRVWAVQMRILREVVALCERHGIIFYADGGTLLGAARHSGYIPWDDDIDLEMERSDYELFMKYSDELHEKGLYVINGRGDKKSTERGLHILNGNKICTEQAWLDENYGCPYIVGIDIFVLDRMPFGKTECEQWIQMIDLCQNLAYMIPNNLKYHECENEIQECVRMFSDQYHLHIEEERPLKQQLLTYADYMSAMYKDNTEGDLCISGLFDTVLSREWYKGSKMLQFEDILIPVPSGYEDVLKAWYGEDWRTPRQNMAMHSYPGYAWQEEQLFAEYRKRGEEIPQQFLE